MLRTCKPFTPHVLHLDLEHQQAKRREMRDVLIQYTLCLL